MKAVIKFSLIFGIAFILAGASGYLAINLFTESAEEIVLPELTGKNIIYVLETLTNMGLNAKLHNTQYHDSVPQYSVTFQDPPAGAFIKKGRDVSIILSRGPKQNRMPDLRQMPLEEALLTLEQSEFRVAGMSRVHTPDTLKDHIVAQYPLGGTVAVKASSCRLLISNGPYPPAGVMPDLKGLALHDAVDRVRTLQVNVDAIRSRATTAGSPGLILDQSPGFGSRVSPHDPVTLYVSAARKNLEMNPEALQGLILVSYALPPGFLKKHVRVETDLLGFPLDLMNEYVKAGTDIKVLIPAGIKTKVSIFVDQELIKTETIDPWHQGDDTGEIPWN